MTEKNIPREKYFKTLRTSKTPKQPSAQQFVEARKKLGIKDKWSQDEVARVSKELGLPIDVNAIRKIEKGEKAGRPTKTTDQGDYRSNFTFCHNMLYEQRLHLVYLMLGCVFLPDDEVAKADPVDLWGVFAGLDAAWPHPFAGMSVDVLNASEENPQSVDLAREVIKRAFGRARNGTSG